MADLLLEPLYCLRSWLEMEPLGIPPKTEPEKLKAFRDVDDSRLLWVQLQSQLSLQNLADLLQGGFGVLARSADDYTIVGIPDSAMTCREHPVIEGVQKRIAKQRRQHPALRGPRHQGALLALLHHSRPEKRLHQPENPSICHHFGDCGQQPLMGRGVEKLLNIDFD